MASSLSAPFPKLDANQHAAYESWRKKEEVVGPWIITLRKACHQSNQFALDSTQVRNKHLFLLEQLENLGVCLFGH